MRSPRVRQMPPAVSTPCRWRHHLPTKTWSLRLQTGAGSLDDGISERRFVGARRYFFASLLSEPWKRLAPSARMASVDSVRRVNFALLAPAVSTVCLPPDLTITVLPPDLRGVTPDLVDLLLEVILPDLATLISGLCNIFILLQNGSKLTRTF